MDETACVMVGFEQRFDFASQLIVIEASTVKEDRAAHRVAFERRLKEALDLLKALAFQALILC